MRLARISSLCDDQPTEAVEAAAEGVGEELAGGAEAVAGGEDGRPKGEGEAEEFEEAGQAEAE